SKIAELDELVNSIGMEKGLRHIYSDVVHVGTVKKVTPRSVVISTGSKPVSLKLENIRLLSPEELREWKADNLREHSRDISVIIPKGDDYLQPGDRAVILLKTELSSKLEKLLGR
ncbi:MAG: prephenate dehydrogenase, partial [Archaeoglobi archaeon]|nr:prephenate dehydrogenase [Archaeoglobi archaeon]